MSSRRLVVLASGGGRSVENLVLRIRDGRLDAELACVISDRPSAGVLERAERLELESRILRPRDFADAAAFGEAVFAEVDARGAELVVLAGFLRLLPIPDRWLGRVLNIHPSLLPAYGGKGFYGDRVHAAVLEAGEAVTGCTVHYVTNEYDAGPVVLQRRVDVHADDTVDALAARVFEEEREALPEAIRRHLDGEVRFADGRVVERDGSALGSTTERDDSTGS